MGILGNSTDKTFLGFTFDGKALEDFGFAVVFQGDRLSSDLQPNFSNATSSIPGRDGMLYWGTEINGRTVPVTIATDRATSRQIANLKQWLRPGNMGEVIFNETPYCKGYAIIGNTSTFNFVPFSCTLTINGKTFHDTLYKGDATISFFFPDPYYYGCTEKSVVDTYIDSDWAYASGLPFSAKFVRPCYLANNFKVTRGTAVNNAFDVYNAGNVPARANILFNKTITFTSGSTVPWTDIAIGEVVISKPRLLKDIDYTLAQINTYSANWAANKTKVLIDLRETLDSELRAELIGIVNATGAGLNWSTVSAASNTIRALVNQKVFQFSINAIELQNTLTTTLTVHNFNSTITTRSQEFVENIGDSTNGKYIIIEGSNGLNADGSVDVVSISTSENLENLRVYFLNTYFV